MEIPASAPVGVYVGSDLVGVTTGSQGSTGVGVGSTGSTVSIGVTGATGTTGTGLSGGTIGASPQK